jgi:pyrophosphatase PpaX
VTGFDPIVFDLDGTVVDTVELIRVSFRYAVETVLGTTIPDNVLLAGVGQPLMTQMQALSPEHAQELCDTYREFNHRRHHDLIRQYDGVEAAMGRLRAAGRRLAIVTSKGQVAVDLAFESFPYLRELSDVVITANDSSDHKPSPQPLLLALERLGASPEGAVYVGDAPVDMLAAKAAGMASVAVLWGLFSRADLEATEPDFVVETTGEMVAVCLGETP